MNVDGEQLSLHDNIMLDSQSRFPSHTDANNVQSRNHAMLYTQNEWTGVANAGYLKLECSRQDLALHTAYSEKL